MTLFPRASGILLHPTSLPGRYGVGDLGDYAYRFVDYLVAAGQSVWQILPLGPTIIYDSPYQTLSALAGNPLMVSLDKLVSAGWLDDYALFMAIKNSHGGVPWTEWPTDQAMHRPAAMDAARKEFAGQIADQKFRQWLFDVQWADLKFYANGKGVRLIGDIPIFVAHDSADVWAQPGLWRLDAETGNPTVVAGVPPDMFEPEKGQLWGNPHYDWEAMAARGYDWWLSRIRATLRTVDIMRIDHFRGFEAFWEVPFGEATAKNGQWVKGPDAAFFKAMQAALGDLPIIAEDLGVITPEVVALRDGFNLPGMKILQFAFGWDPYGDNVFLPHNITPNSIVYTGTHDNNTTLGWWQSALQDGGARDDERRGLMEYVRHPVSEPHWELIHLGAFSVGHTFVAPMQDVLGFGLDARMNRPGTVGGRNWAWRFVAGWLDHPSRERLAAITKASNRWPEALRPKPQQVDG